MNKTAEQMAEEYANNAGTFSTERIRLCSAYLTGYHSRDAEVDAAKARIEAIKEHCKEGWPASDILEFIEKPI